MRKLAVSFGLVALFACSAHAQFPTASLAPSTTKATYLIGEPVGLILTNVGFWAGHVAESVLDTLGLLRIRLGNEPSVRRAPDCLSIIRGSGHYLSRTERHDAVASELPLERQTRAGSPRQVLFHDDRLDWGGGSLRDTRAGAFDCAFPGRTGYCGNGRSEAAASSDASIARMNSVLLRSRSSL